MRTRRLWPALCAVLLVAACGTDSNDPGPVSPPVPTPGPVQLRAVSTTGRPQPGLDVVFSDADGAVLHHTQTDATGQASFTTDGAVTVTLAIRYPDHPDGPYEIKTFFGMRPGSVIETWALTDRPPSLGRVVIDFAERRVPPGTDHLFVETGCVRTIVNPRFQRLQGTTLEIHGHCGLAGDGTIDVAVTAHAPDGSLLGFAVAKNVELRPSETTTAHFTGAWRTDFRTFALHYTNAPAGMTEVSSSVTPWGGQPWGQSYNGRDSTVETADGTRTHIYPAEVGSRLGFRVSFRPKDQPGLSVGYYRTCADMPDSARVDLATEIPPIVSGIELTNTESARPGMTWTPPSNVSNVDAGTFSIYWTRNRSFLGSWEVTFPPDTTPPLRMPMLPESLAALRPTADPQQIFFAGFTLVAASAVSGYREYVAIPAVYSVPGSSASSHSVPTGSGGSGFQEGR